MSNVISMIKNHSYLPTIINESKHDDSVLKSKLEKLTEDMTQLGYKECQFNVKIRNKSIGDDGTLYIEGLASTTNPDLDEDVMEDKAIDSMTEQAVDLTVFFNHNYDNILGKIIEARKIIEDGISKLWIKVAILNSKKEWLIELLDFPIELGFSIGGFLKEWNRGENWSFHIYDILLLEISLTPLPANQDTLGTVSATKGVKIKCAGDVCSQIFKSVENGYSITKRYEGKAAKTHGKPDKSQKTRGDTLTKLKKDALIAKAIKLHKNLNKNMTDADEATLKSRLEADLEKEGGELLIEREIETLKGLSESPEEPREDEEGLIKRLKGLAPEKLAGVLKNFTGLGSNDDSGGSAPEPEPNGAQKMYTQEEVDEIAEKAAEKGAQKALEPIQNDVTDLKADKTATKKAALLKDAMERYKKVNKDMTPEQEKALKSRLQADLEKDNGMDLIEREIETLKYNAQFVTSQPLAFGGGGEAKKQSDVHEKRAEKRWNKIHNIGKDVVDEEV